VNNPGQKCSYSKRDVPDSGRIHVVTIPVSGRIHLDFEIQKKRKPDIINNVRLSN